MVSRSRRRVAAATLVAVLATCASFCVFLPAFGLTAGSRAGGAAVLLFAVAIIGGWMGGAAAVRLARVITSQAAAMEARRVGVAVASANVLLPFGAPPIYDRCEHANQG